MPDSQTPGPVKLVTTKVFLLGSTLYFQNSHDFITGGKGYLVIKKKKQKTTNLTQNILALSHTF